jgi:hypothetical protein
MRKIISICASSLSIMALTFCLFATSHAATITFGTGNGEQLPNGLPVHGQATLVTSKNLVSITIWNLQQGIKSIYQNITGLAFVLSDGKTSQNLVSSAGISRDVLANKSFVDGPAVPSGWQISVWDGTMFLETVDSAVDPSHTIIGPSAGAVYPNADSTIAGNAASNAFLAGAVTFDIKVKGIDENTTICSAIFDYGVCGTEVNLCQTTQAPEPGTLVLAVMALGGVATGSFRRARRSSVAR